MPGVAFGIARARVRLVIPDDAAGEQVRVIRRKRLFPREQIGAKLLPVSGCILEVVEVVRGYEDGGERGDAADLAPADELHNVEDTLGGNPDDFVGVGPDGRIAGMLSVEVVGDTLVDLVEFDRSADDILRRRHVARGTPVGQLLRLDQIDLQRYPQA